MTEILWFRLLNPNGSCQYCRGRPRLVLVNRSQGLLLLPRNSATINWPARHDLVVDWAVKLRHKSKQFPLPGLNLVIKSNLIRSNITSTNFEKTLHRSFEYCPCLTGSRWWQRQHLAVLFCFIISRVPSLKQEKRCIYGSRGECDTHFNYLVSTCLLIWKPVSGPEKLSMNVYKTIDKMSNFELIFLLSIILFEPRREKTCLW